MSIPHQVSVHCPKCGCQYQATIFDSVNSDFAPDIAESIISGKRFDAPCPQCGFVAHLEYDVLYNDMKHGAMVWVVHDNNKDYEKKISEIRSMELFPYDITRIVADMNALREKVACLEANKDDRSVELCKFFLSGQLTQQQPDFKFQNAFYTYVDRKNIVFFYDVTGKEVSCYLEDQVYDLIGDMFKRPLEQMKESPYQIIDSDWAADFFELLPETNDDESAVVKDACCDDVIEEATVDKEPSIAERDEQSEHNQTLFCRKCGAKLLSDSLFCSYCGTKVIF